MTFAPGSTFYGLRIEILALKHHILRNQLNGQCDKSGNDNQIIKMPEQGDEVGN